MTALQTACAGATNLPSAASDDAKKTCFFLSASTSGGLVARVLNIFIKLDLTPYRLYVSTEHGDGGEMMIELRFAGLDRHMANVLAARCGAIIGVRTVLTTEAD